MTGESASPALESFDATLTPTVTSQWDLDALAGALGPPGTDEGEPSLAAELSESDAASFEDLAEPAAEESSLEGLVPVLESLTSGPSSPTPSPIPAEGDTATWVDGRRAGLAEAALEVDRLLALGEVSLESLGELSRKLEKMALSADDVGGDLAED